MRIKTMDELFVETLKDIYYAEKHIVKALPDMVKKAHGGELKKALENLRRETKEQIDRLEKAFEMLDVSPRARKCEAIEGILRESEEDMAAIEDGDVRDAGMIGSAQAIEHYEICRYGTLLEWAKDLGRNDVATLLGQSLEQERNADKLLTQIARSTTNRLAAGGAAA
jgi:ferritin-like metal-binding protein YciE